MRRRRHGRMDPVGHGRDDVRQRSSGHRNHSPRDGQRPFPVSQLGRKVSGQAAPEGDHRHREGRRRRLGPVAAHCHARRRSAR